ncbi:pyridoxine/pyridoxal/pyridoxamine kinase [Chitinolyticbacter meiyuanensis]|uniref:pyridoxine/pyridoxal/pyridoxamine kinase n=1 Tax=Chitinolyticbacter meiyuanensis TaxID=682798 RepID=UPI0011E5BE8B|nr:pyridoxine/pyridoxal/pyridoxamine kinase [Chitinolyticbacter meiyuanensis]
MMPADTTPGPLPIDVISIQSQVVYGSVGNSIAVPALQQLGLRVAAVPTVLLSNTPHYPTLAGGAVPLPWFEGYLAELETRDVLRHARAIQIGYLGNAEQAAVLAQWLRHVRERWPAIRIHLDPVLGDSHCGLYVAPALVPAYRTQLLPLADGLTPNGFELGALTGCQPDRLDDVIAAAQTLLPRARGWIVVTSALPPELEPEQVTMAVVQGDQVERIRQPRLPVAFSGTGDLFAATLTGLLLADVPLAEAVRQAGAHVAAVLAHSHAGGWNELDLLPARR